MDTNQKVLNNSQNITIVSGGEAYNLHKISIPNSISFERYEKEKYLVIIYLAHAIEFDIKIEHGYIT